MKDRIVFNHSKQELMAVSPEVMEQILDLLIDVLKDLPVDGEQELK